jgi:hypothetical protein
MSAAEDHEVISAIDNFRSEAVSTFGDPPVFHKSVPVKIRQHWAGDPALRCPLLAAVASCHSPISLLIPFLNRCFQPHPHQMQHVPIKSLHLQRVMRSPRGSRLGLAPINICTDVRAGPTGTRRGSAGAGRGSSSDSCSDYFRQHVEAAHEKPRERGSCKVHIPSAPLRLRPDPESGPDHRRPRQAGTDRNPTPRRGCAVSRPRPELLELYLEQGRGGQHEVVRKPSSDSRACPRPRQSPRTNYGPHGGTATRGGCSHGAVQNRASTGFSRWWTVGSFTPRRMSCRRSKRQAGAEGGVAARSVDAGAVEAVVAVRQVGDASV